MQKPFVEFLPRLTNTPTLKHTCMFLFSLQLLLQKARHRDSDRASVAMAAAVLANFLKPLYFRWWKTWMLHTLYMDASCYEVSVSHMSNVLDLIFMDQWSKINFWVLVFFSNTLCNRSTIFSVWKYFMIYMSVA